MNGEAIIILNYRSDNQRKQSHTDKNNGFTLTEVLVVVAVVAILASFAMNKYKIYRTKAAFTDVILAAQSIRTAVDVCIALKGNGTNLRICNDNATTGDKEVRRAVTGASSLTHVSNARQWISGDHYYIEVTSEDPGARKTYKYLLKSSWNSKKGLDWQVDSSSTCLAKNLC